MFAVQVNDESAEMPSEQTVRLPARRKQEEVEVTLESLAFDGKAVGHVDGRVIFLPRGLPGERVTAVITKIKPQYYEGFAKEILTPSPLRVPTPCNHTAQCGGCAWQELAYDEQLRWKEQQVRDCLVHLGNFADADVLPIIGCEQRFRYRNKMEFSFHAPLGGGFNLGMHERGRYDRIFDIEDCHLASVEMNQVLHIVRDWVREHEIPVYDVKGHHGLMRFIVLRQAASTGELLVNLVTNRGSIPHLDVLVANLMERVPSIRSIVHNQNGTKSNIAAGEIETVLTGPGWIEEDLLGMKFRIRANSFFQTNSRQAAKLYETAFELAMPTPDDTVADLYCGGGAIGLLLAKRVRSVVGVELIPDAIRTAEENATLNNVTNARFVCDDVRSFLKAARLDAATAPSLVILDPPRAGLHPDVTKSIIEAKPRTISYISCNPSTFARDARLFSDAGYTLGSVVPVDMFPHTKHIELAGVLRR